MKVTPVKRKFGRYAPGDAFTLPDKTARVLIKVGKLRQVEDSPVAQTYQTRMMTAQPVVEVAPYGYKQDGTPRKRPGRAPAAE